MLNIELQFLAGRYHATPWGRNVNEGEVEWPPSPYRLARALVDVWKRRRPEWKEDRVEPLLSAFEGVPRFLLPPATTAHTRSFLSSNERDVTSRQLVFDAFVTMERGDKLIMGFDSTLSPYEKEDLVSLLAELNYLGRSESWIRARIIEGPEDVAWNCGPASDRLVARAENVRLACLRPKGNYEANIQAMTGYRWMDALCLTSDALLQEGWSDPPALSWVDYQRPGDALLPVFKKKAPALQSKFRVAKFALSSKVLPRIQETVSFAERIRGHLMGIHKRIRDDNPALVSPRLSGKDTEGKPLKGHQHAFYLPLDEDGDGRLEHLIVAVSEPFDGAELAALDRLRSVWQSGGRPDVNLVLVSLASEPLAYRSSTWVSVTPFVTSRHYRKGRGSFKEWLCGEITKECGFHGLPQPINIEWIPHTPHTSSPVRWTEFLRGRKGKPERGGYGCIVTFSEPVRGPFALGSSAHFGLGLFLPQEHVKTART
jgi:CRISPR-associated protein Csb2